MNPTRMPSLDELAADPVRTTTLSPQEAASVLARVVGLQTALLARALAGSPVDPRLPSTDEALLTVPEAAARLHFAESYVYELVRLGRLPAVRSGKYVRIRPSTLRDWLAQTEGVDTRETSSYGPRHQNRRGQGSRPARQSR